MSEAVISPEIVSMDGYQNYIDKLSSVSVGIWAWRPFDTDHNSPEQSSL